MTNFLLETYLSYLPTPMTGRVYVIYWRVCTINIHKPLVNGAYRSYKQTLLSRGAQMATSLPVKWLVEDVPHRHRQSF